MSAPSSSLSEPKSGTTAEPLKCRMLVLGGGPGGYSAAFRAADLGMDVILVERYGTLGGVCLNVGCIPSKALLHTAAVLDETRALAAHGIRFAAPEIDLPALRNWKQSVISKLTTGLSGMAKARKVRVVRGIGSFTGPNTLQVELTQGEGKALMVSCRPSLSNRRSSQPAVRPCGCPSCPTTPGWSTPPERYNSAPFQSGCW